MFLAGVIGMHIHLMNIFRAPCFGLAFMLYRRTIIAIEDGDIVQQCRRLPFGCGKSNLIGLNVNLPAFCPDERDSGINHIVRSRRIFPV